MDIHMLKDGKYLEQSSAGIFSGKATVHLGYATYDLPFMLEPGLYEILIRIRSAEAFVPVNVFTFTDYMASIARREVVFASLYGIILAVSLAGTVLAMTRTENRSAAIFHLGFQLTYVAYQLARDGVLGSLLWPQNSYLIHRGHLFMTALSLMFLQLLMNDALEAGRRPRVIRILLVVQITVPAIYLAGLVFIHAADLASYQNYGRALLIAMLSIMLAISGYIIFRSTPSGRMRGLGVQVATWGILVGALKAKGLLPYAYFQYYALGGVMLESLFFMVSVYLRLKDLAAERERLEASLREANLNLLQSRGRPHFLSNTFAMVRAMLKTDPVRADKAFELLVADFRFFTDSVTAPLVSLHDEIAFVENYLAIMSLRHGDRLVVDRHCTAAASCMIPPLSLQPLLENSLKHGRPDAADGILRLSVLLTESPGQLRFQAINHCGLPDNPDYPYGDTHANIVARMRYYHPGATLKLSVLDGNFTAELAWATGEKA
jgi:hypothetical protein